MQIFRFKPTFKNQFYRFYNDTGEDCIFNNPVRPSNRPGPEGKPGGTEVFGIYLQEMYDHDLEFYLPNNFNLSVSTIMSLTDSLGQINDGYTHESECVVYDNFGNYGFGDNIIIVR